MNIRFSLIALLCAFLTLIQSPNYAFASDPSSIDALPTQFDIDSAIFIDDSQTYRKYLQTLELAHNQGNPTAECLIAYTALLGYQGKIDNGKSRQIVAKYPDNRVCQHVKAIHLINSFHGGMGGPGALKAANDILSGLATNGDHNGDSSLFYGSLLHHSSFGVKRVAEGTFWIEKSAKIGNQHAIDLLKHVLASNLAEQNINPLHQRKQPEKKEPGFWDGFGEALLESAPLILGTVAEVAAEQQAIESQQAQLRLDIARQQAELKSQYAANDKALAELDNKGNLKPAEIKINRSANIEPQIRQESHSETPKISQNVNGTTPKPNIKTTTLPAAILEFNNPLGWKRGESSGTDNAGDLTVSIETRPVATKGKMSVVTTFCNNGDSVWKGGIRVSPNPPTRSHASRQIPVRECSTWEETFNEGPVTIFVYTKRSE